MNHPIANICHLYITYSPCQLGDYIYHRSHLLREASETAIEFVVVTKKTQFHRQMPRGVRLDVLFS